MLTLGIRGGPTTVRLEFIFSDVFERVRAPITRTRPNNTRQSTKSKSSATL